MKNFRQNLITITAVIFFSGIFIYGIDRSWNLIIGPSIEITSPKNGETLSDPLVTIEGTAKNISFLSLNGRQIFVDKDGNLKEQLLLSPGYNVVTLSGRDRFGRIERERLELMYQ